MDSCTTDPIGLASASSETRAHTLIVYTCLFKRIYKEECMLGFLCQATGGSVKATIKQKSNTNRRAVTRRTN